MMLAMIWLFLCVLGLMLAGRSYFKTPYALSAQVGVPIAILILYAAFMLNVAMVGYYLVVALSMGALLIYIYQTIKKPSKSALLFIGFSIFLLLWMWGITFDQVYKTHDEFSFWGYRAKALFIDHHMPLFNARYGHLEYPLASPVWQYFSCQTLGKWSISWSIWAYDILLLIPLLSLFLFKPWQKGLQLFTISLLVFLIFEPRIFGTILVDNLLSIWAVGLLVVYFASYNNHSKRYFLYLVPGLVLLVLIKPVGFVFALFVLAVIIAQEISQKQLSRSCRYIIILVFFVIATKATWAAYIFAHHYPVTFNLSGKLFSLDAWKAIISPSSQYHEDVRSFFIYIFMLRTDVAYELSASFLSLLLIITYFIQTKYSKRRPLLPSKLVWLVFLIFGLMYFIFMLMLMSTMFVPHESLSASGFSRYARIYFLTIYMLLAILFLSRYSLKSFKWKLALIVGSAALMLFFIFYRLAPDKYYTKFAQVQKRLLQKGVNPGNPKLGYLWQIYRVHDATDFTRMPSVIYDLLYYPASYNSAIGHCQQIYIDNMKGAECHFTKQSFCKALKEHANYLVVVNVYPGTTKLLGIHKADRLLKVGEGVC